MPSNVATIIYLGIVAYLFRRDFREKPVVTRAVWIPFVWLFIIMSRAVSEWLAIVGLNVGGSSVEEGSPVDAVVSFVLIVSGLRVLARRNVRLSEIARNNQWLAIFFVYCFLAIFWSDFPFVAFKRWFKIIGQPVMALVLLTEPDFELAFAVLMKRLTYVIVPVSILFIKYFPDLGRGFSSWTGQGFYTGITAGKNALGTDCLILGFFFFWYWLKVLKWEKGKARRNELILCVSFLFLIGWLMNMAQSSTSLVSLLIGIFLMLVLGRRAIRREYVGTYILFGVAVCAIAEFVFGASDFLFQILGKDRNLTDRTEVWQDCLRMPINPIIGVGFESFWLGERQKIMDEKWLWHPNEAHNGYLETYLNLGLVGLFLLLATILSAFWKGRRELLTNFDFGRFRIAFLCGLVAYNWTEASFKALHPMWFMFYIIAIDYPHVGQPVLAEPVAVIPDAPATAELDSREDEDPSPRYGFAVPGSKMPPERSLAKNDSALSR
jgi:O-antigen ligase